MTNLAGLLLSNELGRWCSIRLILKLPKFIFAVKATRCCCEVGSLFWQSDVCAVLSVHYLIVITAAFLRGSPLLHLSLQACLLSTRVTGTSTISQRTRRLLH